ncbi:FHA domain-containing protein [Gammaproteobacteria bacterium AB-CW1]|uniref:FHA domain-containing protein n=1 Tax=Natronospira elongata TaxID=3110268 RepID=A0AAP6JGX9_9GAMM|nr:FHA domain-containing protein [Gammaproteobacteria bacterium AB-CW1]MEA5446284.1 FHA domain-containing protein [Gammaproteobacteria bacterium AB-CW1]
MTDKRAGTEGTRRLREQGPQGTVFISPDELPEMDEAADKAAVSPDSPALLGLSPPFVDQWFQLQAERTQIGRKAHNDLVLEEPSVSFEHARIVRSGGDWRVVNLLSTNGTFVNGERIHQSALKHGDRLAFGNAAFLFATSEQVDTTGQSFRPAKSSRRQKMIATGLALLGIAVIVAALLLR